jgi:hypothetical protein
LGLLFVDSLVWWVDVKLGVGLLDLDDGGTRDLRGKLGLTERLSFKCEGERDLERFSAFIGGPSE